MEKKIAILFVATVLVLNAIGLAVFFSQQSTANPRNDYPYLSARIFAESPNDILINFVSLRKQLETKFNALPAGTHYSFYFEYLPSGTSIRIGDNNELVAASLIKLPLVMNLYRAAELKMVSLDKVVSINEEDLDKAYGDLWKKGAGTQLTLRELARLTLSDSDNTASRTIYRYVKGLLIEENQSLAQLDVDQNLVDGQAVINAKSYTSVLKSLYLASYVNRDSSNEILSFLTKSSEKNRLTKELPKDVVVAHKNGVYNQSWAESDCGIVYLPKRPYAVCVMVGLPSDEANAFIADVSKAIYDYTSSASTEQE
jgi:beta-lactamase class A